MLSGNSANPSQPRRKLNVDLIKLIIVSCGGGLSSVLGCFSGITPQAMFVPMLGWMLGFSAGKSQATAMRATAGSAIACVVGAVFRSSVLAVIAPSPDPRLAQIKVARIVPGEFGLALLALFIGATLGSLLTVKLVPGPDKIALRRLLLFVGVCVGMYVAADGVHYNSLTSYHPAHISGFVGLLLVGAVCAGAGQIMGLASGVLLVPVLYYQGGFSINVSILLSIGVIGLAAVLPAWSYMVRNLGAQEYTMAGMIGGILLGFIGGDMMVVAHSGFLLLMFALIAMFLSAREISIVVSSSLPAPATDNEPR